MSAVRRTPVEQSVLNTAQALSERTGHVRARDLAAASNLSDQDLQAVLGRLVQTGALRATNATTGDFPYPRWDLIRLP